MQIITYFNFEGNTMEVMEYYHSILGGEIKGVQKYNETPDFDQMEEMQPFGDYIINASLVLEDGVYFYFSDSFKPVTFGDSISVALMVDSEAEIDRIYAEFKKDAKKIDMELGEMFWGAKYAAFVDKFGIYWQLNYQHEPLMNQ